MVRGDEVRRGDADRAVHGQFARAAEEGVGGVVPVEDLGRIVLEHVSFGRQGNFAPAALEEGGAHLLLQFGDVLAHRGLGDAEVLGGPGEASLGRHHHENAQSEIVQHDKGFLYLDTK